MRASPLTIASTLALLIVSAAHDGHAQTPTPIPATCAATTAASNAYKTGLKLGERIVQTSWNRINDCDRVEYFLSIVEDNVSRLTLPPRSSNSTICRYTGTVDGVYGALDTLYGTCADQCFLDGEFAGELSGEVYCELSIALGGLAAADDFLRGPVQVCGFNFEIGCDSAFIDTTTSYTNTDGVCGPFTEGSFFTVWDQARNNQCAYQPIPEPPKPANASDDQAH
jgi:hypothetical protein